MKDLLLIKKIIDEKETSEVYPVTFDLDDSFRRSVALDIFKELSDKAIIKSNRFTIKDHSFTIDILPSSITRIIEEVIRRKMKIYGIYVLYDNYIEEGEWFMDKKIMDLINEQMNFEFESAYIYKAMAAYTDDLDLDGFTTWLDHQVSEEIFHGEGMKNFLQSVGYKPVYEAIAKPQGDYESVLDVMKSALEHEKEVTRRITNIAKEANGVDERVRSFIQWYIDEQVEEEETFNKIITRLERVGDDWHSIYILDAELGQRPEPTEPNIAE